MRDLYLEPYSKRLQDRVLVPKALALIYFGPAIESLTDGLAYTTGIDCLTVLEARSLCSINVLARSVSSETMRETGPCLSPSFWWFLFIFDIPWLVVGHYALFKMLSFGLCWVFGAAQAFL